MSDTTLNTGDLVHVPQKAYPSKTGTGTITSIGNGYADVNVDSDSVQRWTVRLDKLRKVTVLTPAMQSDLVAALQRTWDSIAQDVADTGGKLTVVQAAEVCADYVYAYGDMPRHESPKAKELSKALMGLTDKDFKTVARAAALSL